MTAWSSARRKGRWHNLVLKHNFRLNVKLQDVGSGSKVFSKSNPLKMPFPKSGFLYISDLPDAKVIIKRTLFFFFKHLKFFQVPSQQLMEKFLSPFQKKKNSALFKFVLASSGLKGQKIN